MVRYHHHIRYDPRIYASTSQVQKKTELNRITYIISCFGWFPALFLDKPSGVGEFCESGGLRKSDHKSRSPILSVWCLHRGTRAVASGNVLLRIALNTLLLIVMLISYPHFRKKGYLLPFYMIGYGVIRCFVEGLRTDSLYLMPGVRVSQVLSGCLILLDVLLVGTISRRQDIQAWN